MDGKFGALKPMINHGIHNSKADYWVHLCPLDSAAYWYRVDAMKEYISLDKNLRTTIGKSKDGTQTGAGHLIPKGMFFINRVEVDQRYLAETDWILLTDREKGRRGQFVVYCLIEHKIINFPFARVCELGSKLDQYAGKDFAVQYFKNFTVEAKTETVSSRNIFIQTHEGNHKPNIVRDEGRLIERVTELSRDEVPF